MKEKQIRKILIVDDTEDNLDILNQFFTLRGYLTILARGGAEVAGADSNQVKIARAFLKKVMSALNEKLKDPNVRRIFDLPELAAEPEQPGEAFRSKTGDSESLLVWIPRASSWVAS